MIAIFNAAAITTLFYKKAYGSHVSVTPSITISKSVINAGDSITFTDNTKGAIRWKWDFGDNEPSYKPTGTHTFLDIGKHRVIVTIYGSSFGPIVDSSQEIVVRAVPKPAIDTAKPVAEAPKVEKKAPAPEPHKAAPQQHHGPAIALPNVGGGIETK